ncbi:MAG: hypothetical protein K6E54_01590 [Bacteroidaceae bacterium]|nr:hypothetical protein [Bacteroidaceae bacterium]
MMKVFSACSGVLCAFMFSTSASAQVFRVEDMPKHSISFNIGFENCLTDNNTEHYESCPTLKSSGFKSSDKEKGDDLKNSLSFNAIYFRNLNNRFAAGVQAGVIYNYDSFYGSENTGYDNKWNEFYTYDKNVAEVADLHIYVMPTAKAYWFNYSHVAMYSRVAAGVAYRHMTEEDLEPNDGIDFNCGTDNTIKFAYQLSPICVEVGGYALRAVLEAGYGYNGYFSAGIRYAF